MSAAATIRAYVPLTHQQLAAAWPQIDSALGFAPDSAGRAQHGEALEEAEWIAMVTAAEVITEEAAAQRCARVVLACDLPSGLQVRPVAAGVDAFGPTPLDPSWVVSAHIDAPDVVATLPDDTDGAADALQDSALLWFDVSEIAELVEAFDQQ
ncbi:hypothetical protein GCM10022261_26780 [Brevibacterium daeguense]|uniref:Uncharacterized protein n=1 Tax=Brevibacterium daeguense TaxID=909936 RepID=A0ABP8EME8_9MICO|nr:hypothetical protein [Brevibacterium daeguense]